MELVYDKLNADFNSYFQKEVKLDRTDMDETKSGITTLVKFINNYISKCDPRFGEAFRVGSSSQGLKTKSPDEFDYNIPLVGIFFTVGDRSQGFYNFDNPEVDPEELDTFPQNLNIVRCKQRPVPLRVPEGYTFATVNKSDQKWQLPQQNKLIFDGDLIPYLVKKQLWTLLKKFIEENKQRDIFKLSHRSHGPAITLKILCNSKTVPEINIDFAPVLKIATPLKSIPLFKWPRPHVMWPSQDKIKDIRENPMINVTAKKPFYWLYSFANCEKAIIKNIDDDNGCRKKSLRILKSLREQYWCNGQKTKLSSYHLKNILFWECEWYPNAEDWQSDQLSRRVMSMTQRLTECITNKNLNQYFNDRNNLFAFSQQKKEQSFKILDEENKRIEKFQQDPTKYLLQNDPNKLQKRRLQVAAALVEFYATFSEENEGFKEFYSRL